MSLRRFAGYFFALTAAATAAFGSSMIGQAMPPDIEAQQAAMRIAAEDEMEAHTALLFQQMRAKDRASRAVPASRILASH